MAEGKINPKADFFFEKEKRWQPEVEKLRLVCLVAGLDEEVKWGCPCYTLEGKNIVLIHTFKEYCALLFFKGVLLTDAEGILVQQTENVQVSRQMRFTGMHEVIDRQAVIKAYIAEAIEVERKGLQVEMKKTTDFAMPEEFKYRLDHFPALKTAFEALTPGRQRAYLLHFAQAKQSKTRETRIEKYVPKILEGKGLDD